MKKFHIFLLFLTGYAEISAAQSLTDSTRPSAPDSVFQQKTLTTKDTTAVLFIPVSDSVSKKPRQDKEWLIVPDSLPAFYSFSRQINEHHPYFGFSARASNPGLVNMEHRHYKGKEWLFYLLVALFILFSLIRNTFPKYFSDLFRVFFRTTLKQRQISEQLEQTPLPSFLLNGFFIITTGLYITFILEHFHLNPTGNFWLLFLYSCIGLFIIYLLKFIGLKITGWLFSVKEAADAYIFIVFVINKMIGILLLPFLVILAFTDHDIYSAGLTISLILIGILLFYRFILTYSAIRNQINVNPFHFFLYLFAFEIVPLLLIYKALLVFLGITA